MNGQLELWFNYKYSSFDELLGKSGSVRIHHRNLQLLAVEIYKALHNLSPTLMSEIFQLRNIKYDLHGGNTFISNNIKTVNYGSETISYLAPKIWQQIPEDIKNTNCLNSFKHKIKLWIQSACPCKL